MDIYRDAKRRSLYLALGTDPEGDSCFSIYQNNALCFQKNNVNLFSIFSIRASTLVDFRRKRKNNIFFLPLKTENPYLLPSLCLLE